jgi:hypothetical protein
LIDLATSKGLDPFVASTWNKITTEDVFRASVMNALYLSSQACI